MMQNLERIVKLVSKDFYDSMRVQSGLHVLVGVPSDIKSYEVEYKERNSVALRLQEKGFRVHKVDCHWPRDKYIWFRDVYVYNYNEYSEGGCFVFGKNYFIASAEIDPYATAQQKTKRLEELFKAPFYLVPSMEWYGYRLVHIDMTISIIESRKLLLVDERHYNQQKRLFEKLAYEQEQNLVKVGTRSEARLWPLNILVIEEKDRTTVVANSEAKRTLKILNKYDLDIITVKFVETPRRRGSIRCITNTIESMDVYKKIKSCIYNEELFELTML